MRLYILAKPARVGYISRLQCLWNREFPDLITTSTALTRRLYVMRNRSEKPDAQTALIQNDIEHESMVGNKVRNMC